MTALRDERRIALALAIGLTAAACVIAALVHVACATRARELLGFPFAGLTPSPSTALAILAHNTGVLAVVFAAIVVVRAPWMAARDGARGLLATMILSAIDTLLALQVALNTALVGVALGAYGTRMFSALLPHGPIEVTAYSLALALYLHARRGPITLARFVATGAICLGALAVAALLETFAAP